MAKRTAISDLNHDNWNEEEEPEEAGTFKQADNETLSGRVIKKAKRRGLVKQVNIFLFFFRENSKKLYRLILLSILIGTFLKCFHD